MKVAPIIIAGMLGLAIYVFSLRDDGAAGPPEASPPVRAELPNASTAKAELETYLRENFGSEKYGASWYKSIKSIRVEESTAIAVVSKSTDAPGVCNGMSGYVYDKTRSHKLHGVRVLGKNGLLLIDLPNARGLCQVQR